MKLLRIKITDPAGFRSLPCGFEHLFRTEWGLQDELTEPEDFAPFVCAGPNGSGKSNLLEALAAIFFQLEILRVRRSFLPEVLQNAGEDFSPVAFELDYLIRVPAEYIQPDGPVWAEVGVWKKPGESVRFLWNNQGDFNANVYDALDGGHADILMPQYVLGYSSGENEILSLPFFKLRFVQFDEYWNSLIQQLSYPGHPETRLAYLDNGFSQAILLCNLLFQDHTTLQPFREDVGIEALRQFRIILKRSIEVPAKQAAQLTSGDYFSLGYSEDGYFTDNPAISWNSETGAYTVNLMRLLEGDERSSIIEKLKRCATLSYQDDATDTLTLDYWVNEATREAFHDNFDGSPLNLFQAFQVLLVLNLHSVSDSLKTDIYRSKSYYVSETVPTLASDERAMRFKNFYLKKKGVAKPMLLKELSDGEHQLLHSLGLCLLFRNTNSLFLLDEPETHFNPAWRASFISRLRECLQAQAETSQEMLITTHSPFLISDSKPGKVLVFDKDSDTGTVSIAHPEYNTLGASINKITMTTFGKRETIGGHAQSILAGLRERFERGEDVSTLITELDRELGDSLEKVLLVNTMLDRVQMRRERGES
ncbi:restriction system-associated AAA family ATPase [Pseudomonas sp. B14(2022)]|uniref:restriction system-associated AAA family ATPase n=1 Tax=Pseudomonas sp. B14(2022) TaxID=2914043 RepID=UPI00142F543C|nr:restriction system-associated AAA family ATPase [Pseudomonas sp. B14(2022)]NJJ58971.1 restriction system-associated AAA family ATPase [Pseudomonas sp. B14(2022)]